MEFIIALACLILTYQDVGASQLIIDGKIGLKSGSQISHFTKDGIVFEDGEKLPADVVIFATGYVHFDCPLFVLIANIEQVMANHWIFLPNSRARKSLRAPSPLWIWTRKARPILIGGSAASRGCII